MDEPVLRGLLDSALVGEPPIGPVARNSLQAGLKLRRRRRVRAAAGGAACLAVVAVAIQAVTGALGTPSAAPPAGAPAAIVYVANLNSATVTPITTATNTPGRPIKVGKGSWAIALTPDGKTAYVVSYVPGTVTPISTATNTPGRPIKVGKGPFAIAITP